MVLTTANFGGFSNFCRYYSQSQMGKSTGYWPTLKPLVLGVILGVVLNYETKLKRNERNETKYYETQRNILKGETKRNATKRNLL
jgi:hypothetical protein